MLAPWKSTFSFTKTLTYDAIPNQTDHTSGFPIEKKIAITRVERKQLKETIKLSRYPISFCGSSVTGYVTHTE